MALRNDGSDLQLLDLKRSSSFVQAPLAYPQNYSGQSSPCTFGTNSTHRKLGYKSLYSSLKTEYYVCVGVSGSTISTSSGPPASTTTSGSAPSPTLDGTATNCNNYHYVEEGDGCYDEATEYGVSLDDFYTWNPGVGDDCSTLQLGYYICVAVSGSTGPSTTTNKSSSTTGSGGAVPTETMPGTINSCKKYHDVISGDECWALASEYGISLDDIYTWNPAVGDDCSALQSNYYVCVGI
ncbi:hypothetical protein BDV12DRAFT_200057 [Aspergillus spectabilis]